MAIPPDVVEGQTLFDHEWNSLMADLRAMKARMQSGEATVSVSAAVSGTATVTFPTAFATAPYVTVSPVAASIYGAYVATTPTTTGFTVGVRHLDGTSGTGSIKVHWQASVNV